VIAHIGDRSMKPAVTLAGPTVAPGFRAAISRPFQAQRDTRGGLSRLFGMKCARLSS
jgi:hypothetical protein